MLSHQKSLSELPKMSAASQVERAVLVSVCVRARETRTDVCSSVKRSRTLEFARESRAHCVCLISARSSCVITLVVHAHAQQDWSSIV